MFVITEDPVQAATAMSLLTALVNKSQPYVDYDSDGPDYYRCRTCPGYSERLSEFRHGPNCLYVQALKYVRDE